LILPRFAGLVAIARHLPEMRIDLVTANLLVVFFARETLQNRMWEIKNSSLTDLASRIGDLRTKKGFSQEDMISHGFSARHWQQIEHGRPITLVTFSEYVTPFRSSPSNC
jgi:hypothetical protein